MELKYNKLLIFDLSHAIHRAIAQPNLWDMRNANGDRTGGIYGTLNTILKETSNYNYFPVAICDGHLSSRRLAIYDNYKRYKDKQLLLEGITTEEPTELELLQNEQRQEYNRQREIVKEILTCLGIPVLHFEDWEGDDLIYILTQITKDSIIVSDDKDMLQMICDDDDRRCRVRRGMRDEFWDINSLKDMGIDQGEYIACKAICGDPSDNIPSACYGVGEKTALGLYKVYQHSKVITTGFPQDEKALSEICKTLNISKRKAYLDFNEDQFLINMLLMDLSLVQDDITQDVLNMIYDAINVGLGYNNYELCGQLLQNQSINSINMNTLINNINRTKYLAEIDSYEISQNISDIVPQKIGGLF